MAEIDQCGLCSTSVSFSSLISCEECQFKLCQSCSDVHANAIAEMYPVISDEEAKCSLHGEKNIYFCKALNCLKAICNTCTTVDHISHISCDIAFKASRNVEDLLSLNEKNKDKFHKIDNYVTRLNQQKVDFERKWLELRSDIEKRRDTLIVRIKRTFQEQIETLNSSGEKISKEISDEIQNLQTLKYDIGCSLQLCDHFPKEAAKFKVIKYYQNFKNTYKDLKINKHSFELKSLGIKRSKVSRVQLFNHIKEYVTDLITIVNDTIHYDNSHEVLMNDVYECDDDVIKDVCYDIQNRHLFLLLLNQSFFIRTLPANKVFQEIVDVRCKANAILPLPDNRILLFYDDQLKVIPEYSNPFEQRLGGNAVLAICSSSCKSFIFVLRKSGGLIKWNLSDDTMKTKPISLTFQPSWMSVDDKLEYFAFSGHLKRQIHIVSCEENCIVQQLGSQDYMYSSLSYLTSNLLLAFNMNKESLDMYNTSEEQPLRSITLLNNKGNKEQVGRVSAIINGPSDEVLVAEEHRIYKVSL